VKFCLQRGREELVDPVISDGGNVTFEWSMSAQRGTGDAARLLGPFAQGPPSARFVYIRIGTSAGQIGSPWTRRAKIPLAGILWPMVEAAAAGFLEAAYDGVARDGGPACAAVRFTTEWQVRS
jgi:hypothetical protein